MEPSVTASCSCGRVQFEADDKPLLQLVCHCADCREASKDDFTTTAFFLASSARVSGELSEREFTAASGSRTTRESCPNCGSFLFDRSERFPTLIGVVARNIDPPFEAEPSRHVWIKSKLPHVSVSDGLPQQDGDLA